MSPLQKVFKSDFCGFLLLNNFFATEITFFHIYHWNLSHRLFKTLKPVLFQLGILLHVCSSFVRSTQVCFIKDGGNRRKNDTDHFSKRP